MNNNAPLKGGALALPFTKAADPEKRGEVNVNDAALRLPFAQRLPESVRNHLVAMIGEYVGTVLFLFLALGGTQVANNIHTSSGLTQAEVGSNPQQLQYIALSFGFSLAVNAWVFFRISGGLFNPAVTVGMCIIGVLPYLRAVLLLLVQILGGITAAALVSCMFPGPLAVGTALGGGTTIVQGLFVEMLLTIELVFTIFMLAAEKHKGTFLAPIGIGLSLFIAELVGVYFTGGSLNPARSFGPAVVNHHFVGYHWIYWLGPILGSFVAAGFYKLMKMLEFETANPNQDAAAPTPAPHASGHHHEDHSSRRSSRSSHAYGDLADRDQRNSNTQLGATKSPAMGEADSGHADDGYQGGENAAYGDVAGGRGKGMGVGQDAVRRPGRGASYAV
ncbi:Aquaporin-1 [Teratosphaeriaceae sp. CCFEE 6253]|nr:Aquaporin-1 [Teratosphaeriaceae sp. CCFEE 6253]